MTGLRQIGCFKLHAIGCRGWPNSRARRDRGSRLREEYFEGCLQPLFMCDEYWSSRVESFCDLGLVLVPCGQQCNRHRLFPKALQEVLA